MRNELDRETLVETVVMGNTDREIEQVRTE